MAEMSTGFYRSTNSPYLGYYGGLRPMLMVRDPELIRAILIKDFQHFHDRGFYYDEQIDPLSAHLLALNGEKWRNLRNKLSPTFTSGKLKAMFSTLVDSGVPLQQYLSKCAKTDDIVDMREISARFATNIIASVAFGIDINCIEDPDTDFRVYGRKAFELSFKTAVVQSLSFISPALLKFFKVRVTNKEVETFVVSVVEQTLRYREENNVVRKDFFQLMVQLRNAGHVESDGQWNVSVSKDQSVKSLTMNEMAAQAFIFYLAGFETSSSTMSFCLYEIAKNPEIQNKLHNEIDRVFNENDGKLTYESVSDMKYLEMCIDGKSPNTKWYISYLLYAQSKVPIDLYTKYFQIKLKELLHNPFLETLRLYPPVPVLNRDCTKQYTIPGTSVTIEKGTPIMIPTYGLHHDEKYYPDPEKFIPERFSDENKKSLSEMPYMPFGEGPRICIGLRMGKMQTKVGLVAMLQKFRFELTEEKRKHGFKLCPKSFLLTPVGGLEFKITER